MKVFFNKKIDKSKLCFVELKKGEKSKFKDGRLIFGFSDYSQKKRTLIPAFRQIVLLAKSEKIEKIAINFDEWKFSDFESGYDLAKTIVEAFLMANFEFVKYKTDKKDIFFVKELYVYGDISKRIKQGFLDGIVVAEEVNNSRELSNTPGGEMTPRLLAEYIKKRARKTKIKVKVLEEKDLRKLKMGALLAVAKGSFEKPKFIILEYNLKKGEKPLVFVGKGVTFDTGGLNLKPSNAILDMHLDMSGASSVAHALFAIERLKIKRGVVVLIPAVENMPSGESYRPGDILKSMSGKTIEVLNTDAEGRLILADALTYAKRYNPKLVVDVATLTGAAMVALGQRVNALFANSETLLEEIKKIGELSGDNVWPMPLWEEYEQEIQGSFGDIANVGKTPYGGAITAASFLHQFAKDFKDWAHIDIAPKMTSTEGDNLAKGSYGACVRLLVELAKRF